MSLQCCDMNERASSLCWHLWAICGGYEGLRSFQMLHRVIHEKKNIWISNYTLLDLSAFLGLLYWTFPGYLIYIFSLHLVKLKDNLCTDAKYIGSDAHELNNQEFLYQEESCLHRGWTLLIIKEWVHFQWWWSVKKCHFLLETIQRLF